MSNIISSKSSNSFEAMHKFSEAYAKRTGTFFCADISVTAVVLEGLAKHKDQYGAPLCPCRHYEDKVKEVANTYWNCPCVPMRERQECHCMLFLKDNSDFASDLQSVDIKVLLDVID
uniref:Ferredoxin-thioredoxin reductase, catalytic chain n=1 Tax=Ptilothamnion sphaericum TaxID=1498216 RepID=A0A4D6X3P8_9FLOR|nr:ferredoxin thioreductase subunit b [Ptilothamnion sphaericum]